MLTLSTGHALTLGSAQSATVLQRFHSAASCSALGRSITISFNKAVGASNGRS